MKPPPLLLLPNAEDAVLPNGDVAGCELPNTLLDSVAIPSEFSLFPNTELVLVEPNGLLLAPPPPNGLLAAVDAGVFPNMDPEPDVVPNPVEPPKTFPLDGAVVVLPKTLALDAVPNVDDAAGVVEEPKTLGVAVAVWPNPVDVVAAAPKTLEVVVAAPKQLEVPKTLGVVAAAAPKDDVVPLGVAVVAAVSLAAKEPNESEASWEELPVLAAPKMVD